MYHDIAVYQYIVASLCLVSVYFVHSHQMQYSSILMDSQKAAREMNVNSMWSGGTMRSLLTLEWREMEMAGLLWALLL